MQQSLLTEVTKKNLDAYVQERVFTPMYWPKFFPLKTTLALSYETLIGSKGAPVAADVIAYDASAPEKTRKAIKKLTGDIPKLAMKKKMSEKDLIDYWTFKNLSGGNAQLNAILDLVYGDIDACVEGVNARMEWLALKAISQTYIALSKTTNGGGIVTLNNIDYGMPAANKNHASVVWNATVTTTKPITDLRTAKAEARLQGVKFKYALMDDTDWGYFQASTETQNFVRPYTFNGTTRVNDVPDIDTVNRALKANDLPTIIIIDQSITTEAEGTHTQTTANPWVTGHVALIPDLALGNMLAGPIMEELSPPKHVTQTKVGPVLISKFSDVDPVAEYTKGEASAFPSWPEVDRCWNLYTLSASTWA